jgi:hypothetical protein
MGLTIIAYALGVITMIMGSYIRDRHTGQTTSYFIFQGCLGLGIMSIFMALAYDLSGWSNQVIPIFLLKVGEVGAFGAALFFLRLAFTFPYDVKTRVLNLLSWAAVAAAAWLTFSGDWFVSGIERVETRTLVERGSHYLWFVITTWGLMILGVLVLFIRTFTLKSRIYRLQSYIVSLTGLAVAGIGAAFQLAIVDSVPFLFPLIGVSSVLYMLGVYWAISITKLFDTKEVLNRTLSAGVFALIMGAPVGAAVAYLLRLWDVHPLIPLLSVPTVFLAASFGFSAVSERFFKAFNARGAYLEQLERGLAEIDFSQGRGIVFERLSELLRSSMSFNDFSVMIEDSEGDLAVAYSNCGARIKVVHKESPFEFVINMKTDIVLKTEAIANRNFYPIKGQLMSIFEGLSAEALVILHEGHHVIGLVGLGAKRTGSDYTAYDAQVLRMIYAKLFAIGFYLKNIAKESILTTVDRELQYSTQIIASVQENIDRVQHPKADMAFISKSTRKLGGDFIDFVKLSGERWFFIMGDVSGKGLNASMSMVILKSTLRVFLKEEKDFSRLVVKANAFIKNNLPRGTFFAGIFGIFDFAKDTLYFVNCGIPVMFMYSPQFNNVMEVQGEGRVLGFVKDYTPYLKLRKIGLQKGCVLFITTDGIIESGSVRGERYGKERVQRSVSEYRGYNAETMVERAYASLHDFVSGAIDDDVTLLALKYGAD